MTTENFEKGSVSSGSVIATQEVLMSRGDKSSYADKQKRQAERIEEGYERKACLKIRQPSALGQLSTNLVEAERNSARVARRARNNLSFINTPS